MSMAEVYHRLWKGVEAQKVKKRLIHLLPIRCIMNLYDFDPYIPLEAFMNELVSLIVKKTGIPEATAKTVVNVVIDYLKKKLPAPIGVQIDGLLKNEAAIKTAGNVLGNLAAKAGKKK
jgi:hypothetical protein